MYTQLEQRGMSEPPVNVSTLRKMKDEGEPIACLTAYDASFAVLVDAAGVDLVLVGDSLGMVIQGHDTTVPVTVNDIVYHSRAVARGLRRAFLVADMPFMSYANPDQALENSVRMMQEGGAMMINDQTGRWRRPDRDRRASRAPRYSCLRAPRAEAPVRAQDRRVSCAGKGGRQELQDAGADIVLLECVPSELGQSIRDVLDVPVIGIGAGPDVDGQILVLYDILDITQGKTPRFVKNFQVGHSSPLDAIRSYVTAVKDRSYPAPEHCFS
jgi:3-methyl-2-oxobutanoate hydroxymethyltransferase